jgi:predicted O-methyltransferase YrrM
MELKNKPAVYYALYRLGLQPPLTQTTEAEQDCLARNATQRKRLVEIGVWHGVNTRALRKVMADDGVLYAVDPFLRGRFGIKWEKLIAHREVSYESKGRIRWLEDFSENAHKEFLRICPDPVDFLFIDGDHSYKGVSTDWMLWSPLVAENGVVALHDSRSHPGRQIDSCGAVRFTNEVIHHDQRFELINETDSVSVFRRRPV